MRNKNNRKGFTIVELVIVIAVIAILATVLVPTISGVVQDAQDAAALQEARTLYTNYVIDNVDGDYEDSLIVKLSEKQYVVILGGDVQDTVHATLDAAFAVLETVDGAVRPEGEGENALHYYWMLDASTNPPSVTEEELGGE